MIVLSGLACQLTRLKRIEVIRGPGSAMYGADAFSGVINIITKTREDIDGTEIGMRVGSFNTKDAWLLHGDDWEGFDVALAFEYHNTDGSREIVEEDAQTEFDRRDGTNASWAPGPTNFSRRNIDTRLDISKGNWKLRTGYQGRRNIGGAGVNMNVLDSVTRYSDDRFNADITYHNPQLTKY
ncbi:TonB-dependent outer membrane receptor [Beggiatoa sp. PS]|nr:TonB-dependent outer membrane receptor [Beggiatoa sp. PS]